MIRTESGERSLPRSRQADVDARWVGPSSVVTAVVGVLVMLAVTTVAPLPLAARGTATVEAPEGVVHTAGAPTGEEQTGTVVVRVTAEETGDPMAGVAVEVVDERRGALTNPEGRAVLGSVPVGSRLIRARTLGWAPDDAEVTVTEGDTATVELVLEPAREPLPPAAAREMMERARATAEGGYGVVRVPARPRARYGILLHELGPELSRYFGRTEGALVLEVLEDAAVPLEPGDVLMAVDGRAVASAAHAQRILASYEPGEDMALEVWREGDAVTVSAVAPRHR